MLSPGYDSDLSHIKATKFLTFEVLSAVSIKSICMIRQYIGQNTLTNVLQLDVISP